MHEEQDEECGDILLKVSLSHLQNLKESSQKLELAQCCPEQWEADQKTERRPHRSAKLQTETQWHSKTNTDKRDVINNVGEFQTKNKHILWKQKLYIIKHKERLCLINTLDSSESETYSDCLFF